MIFDIYLQLSTFLGRTNITGNIIIAAIVNLYQNYPLLETAKSDADLTEPSRIHDVSGSDNAVSLAKQIRTAGGSPTLTRDASARNVAEPEKQDVKTLSNGC